MRRDALSSCRWVSLRSTHPTQIRFIDRPVGSMIIPRHPDSLGNALILHGRLEHHAVGELVDHGALDLLPGRLAGRELEAAAALQSKAALRKFCLRDQHIGAALVEIDADAV